MKIWNKYFLTFSASAAAVFFIISCNAPRNNPVDPQNPNYNYNVLKGYVKTMQPSVPAADINVMWQNQMLWTTTDSTGFFKFENIHRSDGYLKFEGDGFSSDSTFVHWNNDKVIDVQMFLNSAPVLDSVAFYSVLEREYNNLPTFYLEITAKVKDYDNDIQTVFLENSEIDFQKQLNSLPAKVFNARVFLSDLGLTNSSEVIGKSFDITVVDLDNNKFNIGQVNIKRIITDFIECQYPIGNDTIPKFKFGWNRFTPGFPFQYLIQIYRVYADGFIILGASNYLSSNLIDCEIGLPIFENKYLWVIWCIDEFGNRSRSYQHTFYIKP